MLSVKARRTWRKYLFIYGLLFVPIVHFLVFWVYVNASSLLMPFQNEQGMWSLENLRLVWENISAGKDSEILRNVKNTLIYYVTGVITQLPLSFFISYCLFKKILGHRFFAFVCMIPMIVSSVVLVAVYKNMLSIGGPIYTLWEKIFGSAPNFLYDERTATPAIVAYVVWTSFGLNVLMFSGSMTRVPPELLESAKLDGVGFWREMTSIVFPLVWPTFSILLLLGTIGVLSADGPILLFTEGMYGTSTLGYWMYENVVLRKYFNYASALGLYMTVVSVPIFSIVQLVRKKMPQDIQY